MNQFQDKATQYGFAALSNNELLDSINYEGTLEQYYASYQFKASRELLNRFEKPEETIIKSSIDAYNVFSHLNDNDVEMFFIALTNRANKVIGTYFIGKGNECAVVVGVKQIAKLAIENTATGVILCHNHPSGNNTPSSQDIDLTKKVKEGMRLFDITVLDHIIVCKNNSYYSFADEGMI